MLRPAILERMVPRHAPPAAGPSPVSPRAFVLRFLVAFALLEGFVYAVLWRDACFEPYAILNVRVVALLMAPFEEGVEATGSFLSAPTFSILVRPGCDGYQASAVLLAGVVAFPARTRHKLLGAALGTAALMALNLARLGVLLWTGVHRPELFERMHVEVMPLVFVASALVLLFSWALLARRAP